MNEKKLLKEVVGDNEKPKVEDVKVKVDVKVTVTPNEEDNEKKESKTPQKKILMG